MASPSATEHRSAPATALAVALLVLPGIMVPLWIAPREPRLAQVRAGLEWTYSTYLAAIRREDPQLLTSVSLT